MENEAPNASQETQQTFTQSTSGTQQSNTSVQKNTLMAILAYIGILIIIPFLFAREDTFVKFHIKQGLVLIIIEIIISALGMSMMWASFLIVGIIQLALLVLSIMGIVHVMQGKEQRLPLVGHLADNFTF